MKKIYTIITAVLITASVFAQAPEKMSYQAVIRNSSDVLITNTEVGMQISILQGSAEGTPVYVETQTPTSNANGLVTLEIGTGTTTDDFSAIDWANDIYFIKTETDPAGGTAYSITGTSQLMSVPYALHAKTVTTNANLTGDVTSTGNATIIANQQTMTATAPVSITGSPTLIATGAVAISIAAATTSAAGSMSAVDKTKLDGITTPTHTIGESYGGGIIFYLDASGQHGLIAATSDQSTAIQWYNGSSTNTTAFASSVGGGDGNTSMIVFNQGAGTYAAKRCYDLNTGGFTDWYLPSKYELNLMYNNIGQGNLLGLGNVGGFASSAYWSSTEYNITYAWSQNFGSGYQFNFYKGSSSYVRAVRAF